ncbi:MAG: Ig-like domain-containing protein, partial [Candidatus Wallbacteria bacterium]|nr:Ig-like domain-containing protein [Candidatus Wallbacteria bacterium]
DPAQDTSEPMVVNVFPAADTTDVAVNSKISATFSEAMAASTINGTTFRLAGPGTTAVSGEVTYDGTTATFTPADLLAVSTIYTATIGTGVKDLAGNSLTHEVSWSFNTVAAIPVTHGLTVNLTPDGAVTAGAKWSVDNGTTWKDSGTNVALQAGTAYDITFEAVVGYTVPEAFHGTMETGDTTETFAYTVLNHGLTVNLTPAEAVTAGAKWSVDNGTTWKDSGTNVAIQAGTAYDITFEAVVGYTVPEAFHGTMETGDTTETFAYTVLNHGLTVNLTPAGAVTAGAKWSIDAGTTWRNSGTNIALQAGTAYDITFEAAVGYTVPEAFHGTMETGDTTETFAYTVLNHGLTVNLTPAGAVTAGAKWSVDNGTTWKDSGTNVAIQAGTAYDITFEAVVGYTVPEAFHGTMETGDTTETFAYTILNHGLTVNLMPAEAVTAGAKWSVDNATTWKDSGTSVEIQAGAAYDITFEAVVGYTVPEAFHGTMETADTVESYAYTILNHGLTVNLTPAGAVTAGAKWSIDNGTTWRNSGTNIALQAGTAYDITFEAVVGYTVPEAFHGTMEAGDTAETFAYTVLNHGLTVNLTPAGAVTAGAKWSVDNGTTWKDSGTNVALQAGAAYDITFEAVVGYTVPEAFHGTMEAADTVESYAYTILNHGLTVNLTPAGAVTAGAKWSVDNGTTWKDSGTSVEIQVGTAYDITFETATGYTAPALFHGTMEAGDTTESYAYSAIYHTLAVTITPADAVSAGAKWSLDGGTNWRNSGTTAEIQETRTFEITFNTVNGLTKPANLAGTMETADTAETGTYTVISGALWIQSTANAAFSARYCHSSIVYEGKLWVIGGNDDVNKKDVWSSTDGKTWTCVTVNAAFSARRGHTSLAYDGKMWVIGGEAGGYTNDVWSSTDGVTWIQATATAGFSTRAYHSSVVFDNKMWVIGGYNGTINKDIWNSTDGITWTKVTDSTAFLERECHASIVYDSKMWVIGGYDGNSKNDVWCSADGITWTQVKANDANGFPARLGHTGIVHDGKIWVLSGNASTYRDDVWSSTDGITWTQATAAAEFSARSYHTSVVYNSRIWVLGGNGTGYLNDVWHSANTAACTPVDIGLSTTEVTMETTIYTLPATGEIQYNDGTFTARTLSWVKTSGDGNLIGNVYSKGTATGTVEITASYTENSVTVSRKLTLHLTDWIQATVTAAFSARTSHSSIVFADKMWMIGGIDDTSMHNDVWSSNDGVTWSQIKGNDANGFSARFGHTSLVFNNKMWVIGGNSSAGGCKRDVWSSVDGVTWTQATAAAGFSARYGLMSAVFDHKMWVIGGTDSSTLRTNDVWFSTDGAVWTRATAAAAFSARALETVVVFADKMWVIGGIDDDDNKKNDVWFSTDGKTWTNATTNAAFTARYRHRSEVFENKMWVIGGNLGYSDYQNDVWSSADGITWVQAAAAEFSPRNGHTSLVFDNKIWVIGGSDSYYKNDVWYSAKTAANTPVDIGLSTTEATTESTTYTLPATGEIEYNDGTFATENLSWNITSGGGSLDGNTYTKGTASDTVEITGSYTENSVTASRKFVLHLADWVQATATAFSARHGHTSVVYGGKTWVIGGQGVSGVMNDVWSSLDGNTWTQAAADFTAREFHTSVVFNNKMWIIGGDAGGDNNDVLYSTNGIAWTNAKYNDGSGFSARHGHTSVVFDNKMWVIGGMQRFSFLNDVWSSADGITWTKATSAAGFSGRCKHTSIVYDNKMWVVGGTDGSYMNDVWSSTDGVTWTQVSTATPMFSGRNAHTSIVFDNKLWVIGGFDGGFKNDVWSSTNGATWTQATGNAGFAIRESQTSVVFNNKMWVIGGSASGVNKNDVWYSVSTAVNTPVDIGLSTTEATTEAAVYTLPSTSEIQYNDGSCTAHDLTWVKTSGIGSLDGTTYTRGGESGTVVLTASYTDNSITVTRKLTLHVADWEQAAATGLTSRYLASSLVYNSKIWVIGGRDSGNRDDVLSSADNGKTWSQVKANDGNGFSRRLGHTSLVFADRMWVIGGYDETANNKNDIWWSTDGATWNDVTVTQAFPARYGHTSVVFDGKMWVMGGTGGGGAKNDIWYSSDGAVWTQAAAAGFSKRYYHTSVIYDNKMWVIGGTSDEMTGVFNDVWYSGDGAAWTQVTVTQAFPIRFGHTSIVFGNKLWVIGGQDNMSATRNDVWSSADGAVWTQVKANDANYFSKRWGHTSVVFDNKIWVIAAYNITDLVWHSVATAANTPVNLALSTTEATMETTTYTLPTTGEIEYNGGIFAAQNLYWNIISGGGSRNGNVYSRDATAGTVELTASYAINSVTVSRKLIIHKVNPILTVNLTPAEAVAAGAKWSINTGADWRNNGTTAELQAGMTFEITFSTVEGYAKPASIAGTMETTDLTKNAVYTVIGAAWTQAASDAAFAGRHYQTSVNFDNKLWVIGGMIGAAANDVYSSTDGNTWTQVTAAAGFSARFGHSSVVFNNKMWVIGGYDFTYRNDVWWSDDGNTWHCARASSPSNGFDRRIYHTSVVFDDKMWVIGGFDYNGNKRNDVWSSADGITWTCVKANAAFTARYDHTSVVYDNRMWVIGGNDGGFKNDVWSSTDGITWTQATVAAVFSNRVEHTSVVYDNRMWVSGGNGGGFKNDVWSSTDGITWTQTTTAAVFSARCYHKSIVFDDKMWVIGGYDGSKYLNDVWHSAATAVNTPVDIGLSTTEVTMETTIYTLPATGEVQYNDGTFTPKDLVWNVNPGDGSIAGNVYTRGTAAGTVELTASYSENSATTSRKFVLHLVNHNLKVTITPAEAVTAGAKWSIDGGSNWITSEINTSVQVGRTFEITFSTMEGYTKPADIDGTMETTDLTKNAVYTVSVATWTQASASAWGGRENHTSLVYNGKLWVIGGYAGSDKNDVWSSANGTTWTQATAAAGFSVRHGHTSVVFDNKIWVIGGLSGGSVYLNDIWSSGDGITWSKEVAAAGFSARYSHTSVVFNNKLWVIGGSTGVPKNDVWSSGDGITWSKEVAAAGFSARFWHTSVVYDNKLWVIGGSIGVSKNDVWSSTDGINWTCVKANAAFSTRYSHTSIVYDNKLWIIGGYDGSCKNDVWSSTDGITWTQVSTSTPMFTTRYSHTSVVYDNKLWVIGGYDGGYKNDVWHSVSTANSSASNTPVDIGLSTAEVTSETATCTLPVTGEVQYNDGTYATQNLSWSVTSGGGSINGYVYTRGATSGTVELTAGYTENSVTASRKLVLHVVFKPTLSVTLTPAEAVTAGAQWRLSGGSWKNSGATLEVQEGTNFTVECKAITNWNTPTAEAHLMGTADTSETMTYSPVYGAFCSEATDSAECSGRYGQTSLIYNNKMWVIGGFGGSWNNDVWSSSDGVHWTQATASAGWTARIRHTSLVFNNKMWVIGGARMSTGSDKNDVWYSTDGADWTSATSNAGWSARFGHTSLVYDNKMWVIGGGDNSGNYNNDVWCSSDEVNWTQVKANDGNGFSPRRNHTSVVFDNKMWVIGGLDQTPSYKNDVWYSVDGVSWTQAPGSAGWSARYWHTSLVFDNKLWVRGGCNGSGLNDIWYSSDGVSWTQATASDGWAARYGHTNLVYNNRIWVIDGYGAKYYNDAWYSYDTALNTPVDIGLSTTEATTEATVYQLPSTGEVQYNDGSFAPGNLTWTVGGIPGVYSINSPFGNEGGTVEGTARYTENTVTVSRVVKVHFLAQPENQ